MIYKRFMKPLLVVTLTSLIAFLNSSCVTAQAVDVPTVTSFDAKWEFIPSVLSPGTTKGCISEEDLGVFREIINQCQAKNAASVSP